jgi:hypothetical protein
LFIEYVNKNGVYEGEIAWKDLKDAGLYNGGDVLVISSGFYTDLAASMESPWVLPSFPPHYPTKPDGSNPSTFLWVDKRKSKIQTLL